LISVDGQPVTEAYQDWEMMKKYRPGNKVKFKVLRNLKEKAELTLEMGSYSPGKEGL